MSVGLKGTGADQFIAPVGIAITDDDRILIADCVNHHVQVLTVHGQFLTSVGTEGKGPLQFEFPLAILVHPNGQVLVSGKDGNRIQALNQDLTFSHSIHVCGPPRGVVEGQVIMVRSGYHGSG